MKKQKRQERNQNLKRISLLLPEDAYKELKKEAEVRDLSTSRLIVQLLLDKLLHLKFEQRHEGLFQTNQNQTEGGIIYINLPIRAQTHSELIELVTNKDKLDEVVKDTILAGEITLEKNAESNSLI
jgi:hypothetical protein